MKRALCSYLQLKVGLIQKLLAQHGCILIDGSEEHSEKIRQYLHQGLVLMKWSYLHFIITMCTSLKVTFAQISAVSTETTFLADAGTMSMFKTHSACNNSRFSVGGGGGGAQEVTTVQGSC